MNVKKKLLPGLLVLSGVIVLVGLLYYGASHYYNRNPQPTDEEMIAHFQAHRAEIEEIVRRYRAFQSPPGKHHRWAEVPDTRALMEGAKVKRVHYSAPLWLPNPYSPETAKLADTFYGNGDFDKYARHGALILTLTDSRYYTTWVKWGIVIKDLKYYPEVPRIENGRLMAPVNLKGLSQPLERVVPSMNVPPEDWTRCLLRQFEPQWFIRLCRSHVS